MNLKKLAVISNICFWLMIAFQYTARVRALQQDVLNTIVIIGLMAILVNCFYFANAISRRKKQEKSGRFLDFGNSFISLSFLGQLIFLLYKFG